MKAERYLAIAVEKATGFAWEVSKTLAHRIVAQQKTESICENSDQAKLRTLKYVEEPQRRR